MHDCDLIIEAIKENMDDKKDLFKRLDGLCPPKTIFATNTSCLSVTEMATATSRPEKVLGIHFFTPPPLMEGLEIVETILVDKNTLETAVRFGKSLGKTVFVVKDTPGFIANALMIPYVLNAIRMLENKIASKENIDVAMVKGLGYPIGPIALADYFGLDILYSIAKSMYEDTKDPLLNPPLILKHMVMAGRLGRKTGKGFYDYDSFNA
ncbi:MAG TPA: 3-hydroxyacyl-CoA dehydrogenase family protein [Syntrophorhabdaceae bacterium]|nr:3-hydroxyacyl-CoA dehydrogenase family protein [Syntrophorhabdaceae bacterium]